MGGEGVAGSASGRVYNARSCMFQSSSYPDSISNNVTVLGCSSGHQIFQSVFASHRRVTSAGQHAFGSAWANLYNS